MTIEISDCNLLRMRLLMMLERPGQDVRYTLSEFMDRYFEETIDQYLMDMNDGCFSIANPHDQLISMLCELQPEFSESQYLEEDRWFELPEEAKQKYDEMLEKYRHLDEEQEALLRTLRESEYNRFSLGCCGSLHKDSGATEKNSMEDVLQVVSDF